LCQFAVAPELKGQGLGKALHRAAAALAVEHGAKILALDTAAPAKSLIAMYEAWGYSIVAEHDWRPHTNYPSVVMSRHASSE
jgi:GNAT superfamily N-acetyltransferase